LDEKRKKSGRHYIYYTLTELFTVLQITTKHCSSFWKRQIASLGKAGNEESKVMESRMFQYEGEKSIGEFTTLGRKSDISNGDGGWGCSMAGF